MIYEPREDSFLLVEAVKKYAYGRVLDMGAGTGVQALAAKNCEQVTSVLAVDVNPEAVALCKKAGLNAIESDLFSCVKGEFDTIICNTPYLPDDPAAADIALDGGKKGYEWTLRFLEQAKQYLARDGQILFLISTLTNPSVVEPWMIEQGFVYERVLEQSVFFEKLLVYRVVWALPKHPEAVFLAKGKRSVVYKEEDVVIKRADPVRVIQEARMLQKANALGIGPTYIAHTENTVTMQYIAGERIGDVWQSISSQDARKLVTAILEQLRVLDAAGINKTEMTNPYKHIIIAQSGPVLIDWERAKPTTRPQNVAQFLEYIKYVKKNYPALDLEDVV